MPTSRHCPAPSRLARCRAFLTHAARALALAAAAALCAPPAAAQDVATVAPSDTVYEIRLTDGATYIGQIVEARGDTLTLQTPTGVRVQFQRAQVSWLRVPRGRLVNGQFWLADSNRTRLFFAPTGRTLDAGEGYAGLFFVLPFVAYGATSSITISGGLPLIGGSEDGIPFFYLAPKVRVLNTESVEASAGVLAFFGTGEAVAGVLYGVGTWGSEDRALTAGAGVPFLGSDAASEVLVMVGGETRVSRRLKLLTENWLIPGEAGALLTGGMRLMGERWTTDLGLAAPVADGAFFYFPIVSFAYAFGGGR